MNVPQRRTELPWRLLSVFLAVTWMGAGLACWTGCEQPDTPTAPASSDATSDEQPPDAEASHEASKASAARTVLGDMVAAYKKAASYSDMGYSELQFHLGGEPRSEPGSYMVAVEQPNKFRVQSYAGLAVSDGEKLWAGIADQVIQRDAPAEITIEKLCFDPNLTQAWASGPTQAFSLLPLQLVLLLADDPLKTLLDGAEEPELIEPEKIDEHDCHRVAFNHPDGMGVFWIDRETSVLRRFEFPTGPLLAMIAQSYDVPADQIRSLSLVAEFNEAQIGGEVEPRALEFEVTPEVQVVDEFLLLPPDYRPLGKPVPKFSFVDLDGNPVTPDWMAGKIAVIEFWSTTCGPCRMTLPEFEQVYQKYKDNDKLVFVAVSADPPQVSDDALRDSFKQLGVNVPIVRDPEQHGYTMLRVEALPTKLILGPDGTVEYRQPGADRPGTGAMLLTARLEKLLAGESLYPEVIERYKQSRTEQNEQFREVLGKCLEDDLYAIRSQETPPGEIAPKSEPKSLALAPLWSSTELAAPGNILVVPRPDQPPRILVLEEGTSIAEFATQGNVVSSKSLGLPEQELVYFLRSSAGADGARRFVGTAMGVQQVHVWDDEFNLLVSFPQDALENRHAGIADVRIGDLAGDGNLEMVVSYLGDVGVQGVSLDGQRVWSSKSATQSERLVLLGTNPQGRRSILCVNLSEDRPGTLVVLDSEGKDAGEFSLANRSVVWLEAADLDGDGQPEICGLALSEAGMEAVGISREGEQLWAYPLPRGVHEHQIEAVVAGNLLPGASGHWIIPAADGTIHVLDAAGKPIDVFAYGNRLTGLATAEWDGKRVLLVSTVEGVDAWQVDSAR